MTTYSLGAYQLAVRLLRTSRTILVEGPTDKRVLSRMMLERETSAGRAFQCVIDECAMVQDASFAGKGAKEKVGIVANLIGDGSDRFNWLVDREWDDIDVDRPQEFTAPADSEFGLHTKGHSIENYWLRHDALSRYLKMFFGDALPVQFFSSLETRYDSMLKLAAAYSFTAKRLSVVTRCGEAVRGQDILWTGAEYLVLPSLTHCLAARGVAADIATEVNAELAKANVQGASVEVLQWMCHGHLGEEMIRACAANAATEHGIHPNAAEQIERGRKSDKLSYDSDFLARLDEGAVHPLGTLMNWAQRPLEAAAN